MNAQDALSMSKRRLAHLEALLMQPLEPSQRLTVRALIRSQKAALSLRIKAASATSSKSMPC